MPSSRGYELRLPADWPPEAVLANGQALTFRPSDSNTPGWAYDGNTLSTIILVASHPVIEAVHIEVRRTPGSLSARTKLDGFAGAVVRFHSAYDTSTRNGPLHGPPIL